MTWGTTPEASSRFAWVEVSALGSFWTTPICHAVLTDRLLVTLWWSLDFPLDLPFPFSPPVAPLLIADAEAWVDEVKFACSSSLLLILLGSSGNFDLKKSDALKQSLISSNRCNVGKRVISRDEIRNQSGPSWKVLSGSGLACKLVTTVMMCCLQALNVLSFAEGSSSLERSFNSVKSISSSCALSPYHLVLTFIGIALTFSPMLFLDLILCQEESQTFQILFIPGIFCHLLDQDLLYYPLVSYLSDPRWQRKCNARNVVSFQRGQKTVWKRPSFLHFYLPRAVDGPADEIERKKIILGHTLLTVDCSPPQSLCLMISGGEQIVRR